LVERSSCKADAVGSSPTSGFIAAVFSRKGRRKDVPRFLTNPFSTKRAEDRALPHALPLTARADAFELDRVVVDEEAGRLAHPLLAEAEVDVVDVDAAAAEAAHDVVVVR
jgi:hypothetical protein